MKTLFIHFGHLFLVIFIIALILTSVWFWVIPPIRRKINSFKVKYLKEGDYVTFFVNRTPCHGKITKINDDNLEILNLGLKYNRKKSEVII